MNLVPQKDLQPVFTRIVQGEQVTILGVENMWQQCRVCNQLKHQSDYALHSNIDRYGRKFLKSICRNCSNKDDKIVRELKKENGPAATHCYLCNKECKTTLDHCHETNVFRGWLCQSCNIGIGKLKDSVEMLERAIKYLKGELNERDR